MRKIFRFIFVLTVFSFLMPLLMPCIPAYASNDLLSDISGHWAEQALRRAYDDGLIQDYNGRLRPDASITTMQALTIICRIFDVGEAEDMSRLGLSGSMWYHEYAAKAMSFGLIKSIEEAIPDAAMTRQSAFHLLAEAFQLAEADPDMAVLEQFSDGRFIAWEHRGSLASLVSKGLVGGYLGRLNVNSSITRAEFITVVYRIIGVFEPHPGTGGSYEQGVILRESTQASNKTFNKGAWFDSNASDIRLQNVAAESVIIRSLKLSSLEIGGSSRIKRLTVAAQAGDIDIMPAGSATVDTLVVGSGGGTVSAGRINAIEITGSNRNVVIGGNAQSVVVSGQNSTVYVQGGARIGSIKLTGAAIGSRVITEGTVNELEIQSIGSAVAGSGRVGTLRLGSIDTQVNVSFGVLAERADTGLTGASVSLAVPARLSLGAELNAIATIDNAAPGTICRLVWYVNGAAVSDKVFTVGGPVPTLSYSFEYSRTLPETARIRVAVINENAQGSRREISAEGRVAVDNYSKRHWMRQETPRVLEKVTLGYKGDYTLEWALANDLDDFEKEVWVYARGYTSDTQYLLWVNLAYQRVNIFRRSGGNWELIRTCLAGTGVRGRATPVGVWTTSYKQPRGWTTSEYTVRPVVRFWGSSGYAFHSRLYYPGTTRLMDPRIGFPVSIGCVRLYEDDIWFIHDNIPDGTTVVVY